MPRSRIVARRENARRFSRGVSGLVVHGIAQADHRQLEASAVRRVDGKARVGKAFRQEGSGLPVGGDEVRQALVAALQRQPCSAALQREAAEACRVLGDLRGDVRGNRVPGEGAKPLHDVVGPFSRGAGVPDGKRREAVGVHVLGGLHELREARQGVPGLRVARACHLRKDGTVPLHDERQVVPAEERRVWRAWMSVVSHG